jgi:hypothetical protein
MKLCITYFSPTFSYFITLRTNNSPELPFSITLSLWSSVRARSQVHTHIKNINICPYSICIYIGRYEDVSNVIVEWLKHLLRIRESQVNIRARRPAILT